MDHHQKFMQKAIELGKQAASIGEVPVGAVVVFRGEIISSAYNRREKDRLFSSHAEFLAIEKACKRLSGWRLDGCTLYVTLEPCPMCTGAIINSRISTVVFGASDPKAGCFGSVLNLADHSFNHKPEVLSGVLKEECATLLTNFFHDLRKNKNPPA